MLNTQKENILLGTLISAVSSLLMLAISATWFVGVIDKRISVLEKELSMLQRVMVESNISQDKMQTRFQELVDSQLSRMENRIEKIYTLVSE